MKSRITVRDWLVTEHGDDETPVDCVRLTGNNGGSFIQFESILKEGGFNKGVIHIQVGESCLFTIDQDISVAALSVILTWAKRYGFQKILDEYSETERGIPEIHKDSV